MKASVAIVGGDLSGWQENDLLNGNASLKANAVITVAPPATFRRKL